MSSSPDRGSTFADPCWHALPVDVVLGVRESTRAGLADEEADRRIELFGANVMPRPPRKSLLRIYAGQFTSPLIYLLLAAAAVSLAIGELTDAAFIFAVLQINAAIGAFQENKAQASAEALGGLVPDRAVVRRAGRVREIPTSRIVPGDIVLVSSGARVSADLRLLSAHALEVDESLLTGESVPVSKQPGAKVDERARLGERPTMLFAGTTIQRGRAEGVAVETGAATEIGRIAEAVARPDTAPPPLVVRMTRFARVIGFAMTALIALLGVALLLRGLEPVQVFVITVALAVAAIPEGLPVAITVALAIAVNRMARRAVVVRQLAAVEGLGACTMIASDKTGTLTCNLLTARRLAIPGLGDIDVGGEGHDSEGELMRYERPLDDAAREAAVALARAGVLCNEAAIHETADGPSHVGDSVDVAFLVLGRKLGLDRDALLARCPQVTLLPYDSWQRFGAVVNACDGSTVAHVKGAAEDVLPMCEGVDRDAVHADVARLARDGFRVLAVAAGEVDGDTVTRDPRTALTGLRFLGLVGLIDPPRPEALDAVHACREAGIGVCMITGDHPATALAIARDLGICRSEKDVISGELLAGLAADPAAFDAAVARSRVFARVEPTQKLEIVESFERAGHFVAVTGDGANDAPALRAANIGVAMGKGGTDVARDAADLILTDDNFASVVSGIVEGRIAYDNVRKVIFLLISTGAAEIVLFLLALSAGLPVPLFAVQLLWLNLVTNGIQDVALAFEKGEPGVARRKPRPPQQPIFDRRMVEQTLVSGVFMGGAAFLFFVWCLDAGFGEFEARSAVLLLMVLFENAQALNARSEVRSVLRIPLRANPFLVVGILAAQAIHIAAMYTPVVNDVLGIGTIPSAVWLPVVALAVSLIAVMEVYKRIRKAPEPANASPGE